MNLTILPNDVVRYISTFIYFVSWREEIHYFKLLHILQTRTFENIPRRIKSSIVEENDYYVYMHYDGNSDRRIHKKNNLYVSMMKTTYLRRYTDPLYLYLQRYRDGLIQRMWRPHYSFQICGVFVHSELDPMSYRYILLSEAYDEKSVCPSEWQGCVTFEKYKRRCTSVSIPAIRRDCV